MSSIDNIAAEWADNENVLVFQSLGDLNQPYSCTQWGNFGATGMPLITDDTGLPMFGLFHTDDLLPSDVYIDHTMTVYHKNAGFPGEASVNNMIQDMLDNYYNTPIVTVNPEFIIENDWDEDGILDPGEEFTIGFSFTNNSFEAVGSLCCIEAILTIDEGSGYLSGDGVTNIDILEVGEVSYGEAHWITPNPTLGEFNIYLNLTALYNSPSNSDDMLIYTKDYSFSIDVSLNQAGFPVSTAELRASPLVIDLDDDGDLEIIIGDNNGFIRIYNHDGSEVEDDTFPYDTGNQIWGSAAAADMDGDGNIDFVITSKSKHLYIFDKNGLKTDYNADKYLMGTPAIGNLDDDDDLEVVIGGYSSPTSSNPIFAINPDGSDVDGFPLVLGEKVKAGVALADFNGNGKDDIVVGTDDDNIYLIFDDGNTAPGFPFTAEDRFQSAPSVSDINGEKVIFAGSNDNNFYAINSDGNLRFSIPTGDEIQTSPSFIEYDDMMYIFFGSDDDIIYAVDGNGEPLIGWPKAVGGSISGEVVFSTNIVIAVTDIGDVLAFTITGNTVNFFPIPNDFPFTSSPMLIDLEDDGDLEILAGSGGNLFVVDFDYSQHGHWNMHRGNNLRNGYYNFTFCPAIGDFNGDGGWNVLDIVALANCVLANNCIDQENGCAGDMNGDGGYNVLDIVALANCVLAADCG